MGEPDREARERTAIGHIVRRAIPIFLLLAIAVGAYFYWQSADHNPEPAVATHPAEPVPVTAVTVREETVPLEYRFLGQTEGSQTVQIRARVAGHLLDRLFEEGELVEKGQKLFQIDSRPFRVQLSQAQAQLAQAEATLAQAEQEVARNSRLVARDAVTREEYEQSVTAQRVAAADVATRKAEIEAVELQLEYSAIESPITGMAGAALKDVGSYIDAGPNSQLTTVHQVDPIYVRFFLTEQDLLRYRRGVAQGQLVAPEQSMAVELTLADGSTYAHRGRIDFRDVQIDQRTGTLATRGTIPNPDGYLLPGQFVYATILGVRRVNTIRVPQEAVQQSPTGASVYVVNEENIVESRPVRLGEWSGEDGWIIQSGLQPGDRVVVDRIMQVRPGSPVTVTAAKPAENQPADAPRDKPVPGQKTAERQGARSL